LATDINTERVADCGGSFSSLHVMSCFKSKFPSAPSLESFGASIHTEAQWQTPGIIHETIVRDP
jgi:hypothetical protein